MARSAIALVSPEVLAWARERAGYELAVAAKRIGVPEGRLWLWESGEERPTIAQARKAATVYKRSLAVFFLPGPPQDFTPLGDFRRLPQDVPEQFSPELRVLIRRCLLRQEWARDLLIYRRQGRLAFVGSASRSDDKEALANRIRRALGVSAQAVSAWRTPDEALRSWVDRAEARGIFVSQSGAVDPVEARGLSLPDDHAPMVVINSKDSRAARIFTLAHEIVHIWLGSRGVSNLLPVGRAEPTAQRLEVFCNGVAAEILAPLRGVLRVWERTDDKLPLKSRIEHVARGFRVSREVIARRLLDGTIINEATYRSLRDEYQQEWRERRDREKAREGGPPYPRLAAALNGHAFVRLVAEAYGRKELSPRDVSGLLNVKLRHVRAVATEAGTVLM